MHAACNQNTCDSDSTGGCCALTEDCAVSSGVRACETRVEAAGEWPELEAGVARILRKYLSRDRLLLSREPAERITEAADGASDAALAGRVAVALPSRKGSAYCDCASE